MNYKIFIIVIILLLSGCIALGGCITVRLPGSINYDGPTMDQLRLVVREETVTIFKGLKMQTAGTIVIPFRYEVSDSGKTIVKNVNITGTLTADSTFTPSESKIKVNDKVIDFSNIDEWQAFVLFFTLFIFHLIGLLLGVGIFTSLITQVVGTLVAIAGIPIIQRIKKMALSIPIGNVLIIICKIMFVRSWSFAFIMGNMAIVGSWIGWWFLAEKGYVSIFKNLFGARTDEELAVAKATKSEVVSAVKSVLNK